MMTDNEMELLLRSFDEELDAPDRQQLERLLDTSDETRAEHARMRRLRSLVARSATRSFSPAFGDGVMHRLQEEHRAMPQVHDNRRATAQVPDDRHTTRQVHENRRAIAKSAPHRRAHAWRAVGGFAAAAVVVVAIGLALWLQPRTVTVPYGETKTLELADGSSVELGSGSSLTYRNFWGRSERQVMLEGEAFFDVAEMPRPFKVETFNATISVLGTRFNVRAWPADPIPETSVALESGRVEVSPRRATNERPASAAGEQAVEESAEISPLRAAERVVLEPGQGTSILRDSAAVRPPKFISMDHVVAWRSGGLAFVDQPVGSIFRTIERRFNVDVRVTDGAIQDRLLTYLNPSPKSAEDVLSDVCHTLDLRYRHTANGFEILPAPESPLP